MIRENINVFQDLSDKVRKAASLMELLSKTSLEEAKPDQSGSCEVVMLDHDCVTDGAGLLVKLNMNERDQLTQLIELFPDVASERILDVYEKCQKDFHWTADTIRDLSAQPPCVIEQQAKKENDDSELVLTK